MTPKLLHAIIADLSYVGLLASVAVAVSLVNKQLAYIMLGLFVIRTVAKFLLAFEQAKEDEKYLQEFNKLLKDKQENE